MIQTEPGTVAGNIIRIMIVLAVGVAVIAWLLMAGGCAHLPTKITTAAARGCSLMLEEAAAVCGDPVTPSCAARAWNVSEADARALLRSAERVYDGR